MFQCNSIATSASALSGLRGVPYISLTDYSQSLMQYPVTFLGLMWTDLNDQPLLRADVVDNITLSL